tara:strand:- start:22749 stop:23528 length:780 start_codon:yes stop_codon:yes gene_type:complete
MTPDDILKQATDIITGKRDEYGEPENNFDKISRICDVLELGNDPQSIALRMVVLKLVRAVGDKNNVDHYVDMAGYASHAGAMCYWYRNKEHKVEKPFTSEEIKAHNKSMELINDGWIEWYPENGIDPPLDRSHVDIKRLDGSTDYLVNPTNVYWEWRDMPSDITHWKESEAVEYPKWPNNLPSDLLTPMPEWYYEGLDRLNKDTWHEWNPDRSLEPPYHHDLVDVKFLDGEVFNRKHPKNLRWQWLDLPSDITHWRPSK